MSTINTFPLSTVETQLKQFASTQKRVPEWVCLVKFSNGSAHITLGKVKNLVHSLTIGLLVMVTGLLHLVVDNNGRGSMY